MRESSTGLSICDCSEVFYPYEEHFIYSPMPPTNYGVQQGEAGNISLTATEVMGGYTQSQAEGSRG